MKIETLPEQNCFNLLTEPFSMTASGRVYRWKNWLPPGIDQVLGVSGRARTTVKSLLAAGIPEFLHTFVFNFLKVL